VKRTRELGRIATAGPMASSCTEDERRWPDTHSHLPKDKRLNAVFDAVPGVSCCPFQIFEAPIGIALVIYYWSSMTWALSGYMFLLFCWKECVPMSGCLHRYWSHKSFKCGRATQFVLYLLACLASQAGPLWWASKHRRHHAHCDTENDPHSPVQQSKLYAWIGWVYLFEAEGAFGSGVDEEYIVDHLRYPELALMENFFFVPILLLHYAFYCYGGIPWLVHVSILSSVVTCLATLYFNVLFHDDPHVEGSCKARDIPYDCLAQLHGEAYHAWHHVHPRAYHRPGLDATYWCFILPGLMLGFFEGPNIVSETKSDGAWSSGVIKRDAPGEPEKTLPQGAR